MMSVPSNKVGLVMGKGGETIRSICSESGAHCQVDKSAPDGARDKNIVIKGRPDAVERAKEMISDRIGGGGYDRGPLGGGVYEPGYPAAAGIYLLTLTRSSPIWLPEPLITKPFNETLRIVNSVLGVPQPDYSSQWAEYYRSLGMVKEAEVIEQQSQARAAPVQSQQASDYSAQWAEYYRSVGKIQEAEAIEVQMRVKGALPQPQLGAPGQPPLGSVQYGHQQQFY